MSEPTLTRGQRVVYTDAHSKTHVAVVLRQKDNGLVDLRVLPDAQTPMGDEICVRAVAYDSGGGDGTYAFGAEGASEIPIEDSGDLYTATDVEGALAEVAAATTKLVKRTVTIGHADLTDAVNGEAQAINVGAALPANAVVLGHEIVLTTQFTGGSASAVTMDLGGTDADAIVAAFDVKGSTAGGAKYAPGTGIHPTGKFSSEQLVATFTPDGGHTLDGLTAGALTINVWYVVLA